MVYLLSIVVPTKDRYHYLKHLIQLIKDFNNDDIELIVQDNTFNNKEILEFINQLNYPHLKYYHTKEQIPIYLNSDKAIRNSTGEYVCFVGDDDGVIHSIVDACRWMKQNYVDCLTCKGFYYRWPDANTSSSLKGALEVTCHDYEIKTIDTQSVLERLMKRGMVDRGDLPLVYHGIVKRSILDKIWDKCGSYFPGASPDIANGVALCLVADRVAISSIPYAYSGASQHLGGGATKMKHQATTDFKSLSVFTSDSEIIWNKRVPKVWAACSIWCESAIEAMNKMGRTDLVDKINYEALYTEFVSSFYYYRTYAYQLTNNRLSLFARSSFRIIFRFVNKILGRIRRVIIKDKNSTRIYNNLENVSAANQLIDDLLKKQTT